MNIELDKDEYVFETLSGIFKPINQKENQNEINLWTNTNELVRTEQDRDNNSQDSE